ncbi:gamma-glutamylputrescine oxidase [Dongia mobilis]|uniref:Gamma-glutamylputrescine oxidase n=1 Tax=Dongia mobilis TaxID=578943 RepID=A0A4R6WRE2_9PROT|nr:FAD-binding oxidoreductase [Dongia mobilis]TDQ81034.1 gamma-glutamylputrescine oxidase [Dongia mobilis]
MGPFEHPQNSYYAATANPFGERPALAGAVTADVCVVGGGFTGLSAALNLAERGYKVVLLEQARIAWGASGRNGGQVNLGLRKGPEDLIAAFGQERARALFGMAEESRRIVTERIARHGIKCDFKPGTLHAASKARDCGWMQDEIDCLERQFGYRGARYLDRAAVRQELGSDIFHAGVLDSGGGHLHPLNYALGLAAAAEAAGVQICEQSRVTRIEKGTLNRVETSGGAVSAKYVVLACNAYLGDLEPRIAGKIMPIANFIIATEPLSEAEAREVIARDVCVADTKFVVSYWRLSADRRLLFGGGERYSTQPPADIKEFVKPYMLRVYPQLAGKRIDFGWGGMLAITVSRLPHVGRMDNVFYAHGYSGQGVAVTGIIGQLIAEAVAGTAERFDLFAAIRHQTFPGGTLLRHPLLVAAMLWYAMRDRL